MSREIKSVEIENKVKDLCIEANTVLRPDVLRALETFYDQAGDGSLSREMLKVLIENAALAEKERIPLCQDTGMVVVFIELGRDVAISGGDLTEAVNKGVEKAYVEGLFRKSVVEGPIIRKNTGSNTPAVMHVEIVEGDKMTISVMPKGFGSENKSRMAMLNPTCNTEEIAEFCVETVKMAGPDACPPYVLGIGIGGTMDSCALLAKKALLRPIDEPSPEAHIAKLERMIAEKANALDIGIMGLGGKTTVMGVNIEEMPTHIAGCPVAVNICCHALRSASATI